MEISTRKSYFIEEEEDDRLVSLSEIHPQSYYHYHQFSVSSPRSGFFSGKFHGFRFDNNSYRQPLPHFLDSCFVCKKSLDNRDIFMYRDKPFCREECREEQIEKDEAKEKKQSLSSSVKAMRRNEKKSSSSSSPTRSRDYALHTTGTVAAA